MTRNEKGTAVVLALVALWWLMKPAETVTTGIHFEGVVDDTEAP